MHGFLAGIYQRDSEGAIHKWCEEPDAGVPLTLINPGERRLIASIAVLLLRRSGSWHEKWFCRVPSYGVFSSRRGYQDWLGVLDEWFQEGIRCNDQ
jgi:hypothetical protein